MENFLERLRNNDSVAFRFVYDSSYKICASYVIKNNGSHSDAEDIFQESLLVLLSKIREKEFKLSSKVSTFLYAVSKRKWLNKIRKKSHLSLDTNLGEYAKKDVFEEGNYLAGENLHKFQIKALRILNNFEKRDCVIILNDFYFENKSISEIAEKQGYTLSYTKKKKANCLKYLKNAILSKTS